MLLGGSVPVDISLVVARVRVRFRSSLELESVGPPPGPRSAVGLSVRPISLFSVLPNGRSKVHIPSYSLLSRFTNEHLNDQQVVPL